MDSQWTVASVDVTVQLYNYSSSSYSTGGDGYISYTSGVANTDELKDQTITSNPEFFRDGSGNWKAKITGIKISNMVNNHPEMLLRNV